MPAAKPQKRSSSGDKPASKRSKKSTALLNKLLGRATTTSSTASSPEEKTPLNDGRIFGFAKPMVELGRLIRTDIRWKNKAIAKISKTPMLLSKIVKDRVALLQEIKSTVTLEKIQESVNDAVKMTPSADVTEGILDWETALSQTEPDFTQLAKDYTEMKTVVDFMHDLMSEKEVVWDEDMVSAEAVCLVKMEELKTTIAGLVNEVAYNYMLLKMDDDMVALPSVLVFKMDRANNSNGFATFQVGTEKKKAFVYCNATRSKTTDDNKFNSSKRWKLKTGESYTAFAGVEFMKNEHKYNQDVTIQLAFSRIDSF